MKENVKKLRESNIELCRIICMLMIIAHHCVVHGGGIGMEVCTNKYISLFLFPGGKLCFDTFLAISMWFLVDQTFKAERFFKTWGQVFFYSVSFFVISVFMGTEVTKGNVFSVFFPITGNSHGFASSYLAFYLLLPALNYIAKNITKNQAKWIVLVLFYVEVISQLIGSVSGYYQPIYNELVLFVLCYFIALYLKRYPFKILSYKWLMLGIAVCAWLCVYVLWCMATIYMPGNATISFLMGLCRDESSILYIVGGYALFFFFYNIKIPTIAWINKIAHTTFGTLLFHDHNFFRYILWGNIVCAYEWYYSKWFVARILLWTFIIFVLGIVLEFLRQNVIEKFVFSRKCVQNMLGKVDAFLKN